MLIFNLLRPKLTTFIDNRDAHAESITHFSDSEDDVKGILMLLC